MDANSAFANDDSGSGIPSGVAAQLERLRQLGDQLAGLTRFDSAVAATPEPDPAL